MDRLTAVNCRKAAVLADIHGNYPAFKACCEDAKRRGAECFIFLGDYISDLADPRKCLDLVYELSQKYPTICIRGNRERYMLECKQGLVSFQPGSKTGSLLYTYHQLRPRDFRFIESLPIYQRIALNGIPFEIAHGVRDDDRYYFDGEDARIEGVFAQMECEYLLAGHSHKQYIRQKDEKTILNPGSVGVPRGHEYMTQYALLEFEGQDVRCVLRHLPYDVEEVIRRQFESGLAASAPCWAVSLLYDVITGEEYTLELLERVFRSAGGDEAAVHDEALWRCAAMQMGMKFTQDEILAFFSTRT